MNKTECTTEIIVLDEKQELRSLSNKIDDSSGFLNSLHTQKEKKLYKNVLERLRRETKNQLTETEYSNIARMLFWCDRFEEMFAGTPSQDIDPDLFNIYRMMITQVTDMLRDFREKSNSPPSSVKEIRNYIINMQPKKKEEEIITIDVESTDN